MNCLDEYRVKLMGVETSRGDGNVEDCEENGIIPRTRVAAGLTADCAKQQEENVICNIMFRHMKELVAYIVMTT